MRILSLGTGKLTGMADLPYMCHSAKPSDVLTRLTELSNNDIFGERLSGHRRLRRLQTKRATRRMSVPLLVTGASSVRDQDAEQAVL